MGGSRDAVRTGDGRELIVEWLEIRIAFDRSASDSRYEIRYLDGMRVQRVCVVDGGVERQVARDHEAPHALARMGILRTEHSLFRRVRECDGGHMTTHALPFGKELTDRVRTAIDATEWSPRRRDRTRHLKQRVWNLGF